MNRTSKIREAIGKNRALAAVVRRTRECARRSLCRISPELLVKWRYRAMMGRKINLARPQTFDEKLAWLMLYWRHPLKTRCADKCSVRGYAEELGLGELLPDLLGVYGSAAEIEFSNLPERFVLKCTHGWGCNIICRNKDELNYRRTRRQLDAWLRTDFSKSMAELHYAGIPPRIICEEYLEDGTGKVPTDYKVYCFQGRAHCTMVCTERGSAGGTKFDYYDRTWERKLPYSKSSELSNRQFDRPVQYDEMIRVAETLSKPFPFVRVDLYAIADRTVLGEMTFTPSGCIDRGYSEVAQRTMGGLIVLPAKFLG